MKTAVLTSSTLFALTSASTLVSRDDTFDWSSVVPSTNLSWTPCHDSLQCARLTVPLQYSNPGAGEAQIAIIMSPSNLSHSDPDYLGPILINPGGPGGSGVDLVLQMGALIRSVVGPQFDVVSFDPRGVSATTPPLNFFASPAEQLFFHSTFPENANESASAFGIALAQSQIMSKLAADRTQLVAESVGTVAVATDMLNIMKAFGTDKLNYYGLSYGTVLGATFASLYPENVGRFILDGVVNGHDYYAGNTTNFLASTDDALTSIYDSCVVAGPELCPIYANTSDQVRDRVNRILDAIHLDPIAAINDTDPNNIQWEVVDYTAVTSQLFQVLYTPYLDALGFAEGVIGLEKGDASIFLEVEISPLTDICPANASAPFTDNNFGAMKAIWFGDSLTDGNRTFAEAKANYEAAVNLSEFNTQWYPANQAAFTSWTVKAADRFNGSFTKNTSTPILFIGNTFDPVTPLASAHNMSSGFAGSVVLQQNSTGHTSQSGFSTCTALAIQQYLTNLTLPAAGTICPAGSDIWTAPSNTSSLFGRSLDAREPVPFEEAVRALARTGLVRNNMMPKPMKKRFAL